MSARAGRLLLAAAAGLALLLLAVMPAEATGGTIEAPAPGATVVQPLVISGWAVGSVMPMAKS